MGDVGGISDRDLKEIKRSENIKTIFANHTRDELLEEIRHLQSSIESYHKKESDISNEAYMRGHADAYKKIKDNFQKVLFDSL